LAGRFEPPHDLLSLPGLAVCVFNSVIQALVGSMISIRGQILYRLYVAAQLVRHDDTRFTELLANTPTEGQNYQRCMSPGYAALYGRFAATRESQHSGGRQMPASPLRSGKHMSCRV
jgi:hypothetical protein